MRSMSTAERLPKSSEPSVAVGLPTRTPSISTSVCAGVGGAQTDLRHAADAAGFVDVEASDATQHVGDALGPELLDFGGADDGHRGAGLADRLFDAIGGDDNFRQWIGVSGGERHRAGRGGEDAGGPRGGPRSGFEHGSSSRPTDGGLGCTVKGRSPGSRLLAPLLLPRTLWVPVDDMESGSPLTVAGAAAALARLTRRTAPRSRLARLAPDRR